MDFTSFPIWTAIHVKDVAVAIKKILNKFNNKIINLAYKNPMCAEEVIQYLYKIYKKKFYFLTRINLNIKTLSNLITTSFKNRLKEEVLNYHD